MKWLCCVFFAASSKIVSKHIRVINYYTYFQVILCCKIAVYLEYFSMQLTNHSNVNMNLLKIIILYSTSINNTRFVCIPYSLLETVSFQ